MNDSEKSAASSARAPDTDPSAQQQPTEIPVQSEPNADLQPRSAAGDQDLEARLATAQQEIDGLKDQALRAHAEMENVRRRAERDVQNAHKFGLERLMNDLLEVVDSLERGLLAADTDQVSVEQLKEGTELTHRLLDKLLERHGVKEISPAGERFDPEFHEALTVLPTTETEPDTVVQVIQKGYQLNDRLIRPARVIVARQP